MKHIVFPCLCALLIVTVPKICPAAPSNLVILSDSAYHLVDTLQKAGIVIGYPDGDWSGVHKMTRYEFAVAIARLLAQAAPHMQRTGAILDNARQMDFENRFLYSPQAIAALKSLVDEFTPELVLLQQNVAADRDWLASLAENVRPLLAAKPFADVPAGHWAASSVESLCLHSLIAGYGDGKFTVSQ